jgi:hypothetical protein
LQEKNMQGIPLTDIASYSQGYIPNFAQETPRAFGQSSIIDATNIATMLVPEGGSGTAQYQFKGDEKKNISPLTVTCLLLI